MQIEEVKGVIEVFNSDARNAMHSILGFLELLSDGALNPQQREYIDACRAAADRHCRGIEDVNIVLGIIPEERQVITDFSPAELFGQVAEVIGVIARRKGISLVCRVDNSVPPTVSADVDCIGKALLRFAEGVLSAINEGALRLSLASVRVPDGFNLTFEIFGSALPPASVRALQLDKFELDASLGGGGTIGLVTARKLATALGGTVDASIDASAGSRIAVTIPVGASTRAARVHPEAGQPAPDAQRSIRILVAEDSDDSFQLFQAYMQGQPHFVARATNGVEAVELATKGTFDLLFMDIRMPIMDGYAATQRIRELETGKDRPRMPIVVLSAEDLRTQRRQGALAGCSGFLSKPLRKLELLEAIRVYSVATALAGSSIPTPVH